MNTPRIDRLDQNFIINGNMDYFQRALSTTNVNIGSTLTTADRFYTYTPAGNVGVIKRTEDYPSTTFNGKYCLEYALTTTVPDVGNGKTTRLIQRIESIFARELGGEKGSISFWYKTPNYASVSVSLSYATTEDNFTSGIGFYEEEFEVINDDTWRKLTIEDIDFPTLVKNGIQFVIWANNPDSLGVTNFKITAVKINKGSKAQEFSYAAGDVANELILCQRYFEKTWNIDTNVGTGTGAGAPIFVPASGAVGGIRHFLPFKVLKRVNPSTVVYSTGTGNPGFMRNISNGTELAASAYTASAFGGGIVNEATGGAGNVYTYQLTADAEL